MLWHLQNNKYMRNSLSVAKVLWVGPCADEAFKALYPLDLTALTVVVSTSTTKHANAREERMRAAFPTCALGKTYELKDALGLDELLALRGIPFPEAMHVARWRGAMRDMEEVNQLRALLKKELRQPHPDFEEEEEEVDKRDTEYEEWRMQIYTES